MTMATIASQIKLLLVERRVDEALLLISASSATQVDILCHNALVESLESEDISLDVFSEFLHRCPHQCTSYKADNTDKTLLHMAVLSSSRPGIIQVLVKAAPKVLEWQDWEGLRPIDILTQRILMKEEKVVYMGSDTKDGEMLTNLWECARILTAHHGHSIYDAQYIESGELPTLHACLSAGSDNVPTSLIARALQRFPDQLSKPDAYGNLPLHIVAQRHFLDEDDDNDCLDEIVERYPMAARVSNHQGFLPLDCAIASGRGWSTGINRLLRAYPVAFARKGNIPPCYYPLLFHQLLQRRCSDVVFEVFKGKQNLFQGELGSL